MKLISIKGLTVKYDGYTALENVNLDIYDDDFIGVIGPNGGGKTTLVRTIVGALPYSGTIEYADELYDGKRRLIGYMPQQSKFDRTFPISVLEVVMSGLQSEHGFTSGYTKSDRERACDMLAAAGIYHLKDKQIGEISGGEMQRALLCRAIIMNPRLLILDEPANFVDNRFENELYSMLEELNKRMAIIMVSHDLGTITSIVKSIVCVNRTVHRHDSNIITPEQLENYRCPIQIITHGTVPHTVLGDHK